VEGVNIQIEQLLFNPQEVSGHDFSRAEADHKSDDGL
jgi:hypothetical protein